MRKFLLKRILILIPTVFVVIFIIFTIMNITPGDPGRLILGPTASQSAVDEFNERFGINDPFFTRFFDYCAGLLHGDFGTSYRSGAPVIEEIFARFPYTLILALASIVIGAILGIALGVLSAVKQYSLLDSISTSAAMILGAVPTFLLGMLAIYIFSYKLELLPSGNIRNWTGYILPILTVAVGTAAGLLRITRAMVLETIRQDYIRTARAKGAAEKRIIWKHALKNALLPVITTLGMRFGASLGGSVVVEQVFNIPGLGNYILTSIQRKDMPAVLSSIVVISIMFCLVMLVVDIIYALVDPRIKAKYIK